LVVAAIQSDMQLGLAGENAAMLPGVTLRMLSDGPGPRQMAPFRLSITDGTSSTFLATEVPPLLPVVQSPIQLAAFGDGSVRTIRFFSDLHSVDPTNPNNQGWFGPWSSIDQDGNKISGIMFGLLLPAVRPGEGQTLPVVLIAQEGIGSGAPAPGAGRGFIHFVSAGPGAGPHIFSANFRLEPFIVPQC
jgi:hypothetical protein